MDKTKIFLIVAFFAIIGGIFAFRFLYSPTPPVVQKQTSNIVTDTLIVETVDFDAIKAKKSKDYVLKIDDELSSSTVAADGSILLFGEQKETVSKDTPEEKVTDKKSTVYVVKIKQKDVKLSDVTIAGAKAVLKNKTAVIKVEKPAAPQPSSEPPAKK